MLYSYLFLIPIILCVACIGYDSHLRNENTLKWSLFTFVFTIIAVPMYFATRNLKKAEVRKGGGMWNMLKYFAFVWSVGMAFSVINAFAFPMEITESSLATLSITTIVMIWAIPAIGALGLGYFFKNPSQIEKGPIGS